MKTNFSALDTSILEVLTKHPSRMVEILGVTSVRDEALRINRRRSGTSPSESADITINEQLQALRRSEKITYDPATNRWLV